MSQVRNKYAAVFFGIVVALGGLLTLGGWIFDIEDFIHPVNFLIPIKPITSATFIVSGLQLIISGWFFGSRHKHLVMPLVVSAALFEMVVMSSQLAMALTGAENAIEFHIASPSPSFEQFHLEHLAVSLGTMLIFFNTAAVGLLDNLGDYTRTRQFLYLAILAVGLSALMGYALDAPALYFNLPGISNPIAIYTAVLGLASGLSIRFSSVAVPTEDTETPEYADKDQEIET